MIPVRSNHWFCGILSAISQLPLWHSGFPHARQFAFFLVPCCTKLESSPGTPGFLRESRFPNRLFWSLGAAVSGGWLKGIYYGYPELLGGGWVGKVLLCMLACCSCLSFDLLPRVFLQNSKSKIGLIRGVPRTNKPDVASPAFPLRTISYVTRVTILARRSHFIVYRDPRISLLSPW